MMVDSMMNTICQAMGVNYMHMLQVLVLSLKWLWVLRTFEI